MSAPPAYDKKEIMIQKRLKAKEKTIDCQQLPAPTKQELRRQRNRQAAQKSRDRRRSFIEALQKENNLLRGIINQCSFCSQQCESLNSYREEPREDEELIIVNMTEPDHFMREQSCSDVNSQSGLNKYFWFTCILIVLCMANFRTEQASSNRELVEIVSKKYLVPPEGQSFPTTHSNLSVNPPSKALAKKEETNYCTQCFECLKNRTSSNTTLSLLREEGGQTVQNTTSNIIFCPSKAQFFGRVYEALSKESQSGNRQISRLMIKGKALKLILRQDCFRGEEIKEQEQYAISFTLAIFQLEPLGKK